MKQSDMALPPVGAPLLTLEGVTKHYGEVRAVDGISLSIPRGSIYGFLGPNGAGKTTTIRGIMNIVLPDSGTIRFAGRPMTGDLRDRIGYLPEERGLYRKMKCREQLAYLGELKGMARKPALAAADDWMDRLELGDWKDHKVADLSKGMQQKIQFAATFIFKPDLVILDEVFSGLDPLNIELLRDMILTARDEGTTIIFSTHMLAEAEKICDAVCLIEGGQMIIDGPLDQVRANFPRQRLKVAWDDGREPPQTMPGVAAMEFADGVWQLTLDDGIKPSALLPALQEVGNLTLFSGNRPTLSEIFLEAVARHRQEVRS